VSQNDDHLIRFGKRSKRRSTIYSQIGIVSVVVQLGITLLSLLDNFDTQAYDLTLLIEEYSDLIAVLVSK